MSECFPCIWKNVGCIWKNVLAGIFQMSRVYENDKQMLEKCVGPRFVEMSTNVGWLRENDRKCRKHVGRPTDGSTAGGQTPKLGDGGGWEGCAGLANAASGATRAARGGGCWKIYEKTCVCMYVAVEFGKH